MSTPRPLRILEWNLTAYKRLWRGNLLASFLQPLLYLLAMGLGVGALVNHNSSSAHLLGGLPYVAFVAPGLLATTAMMVSATESMWPILDALSWGRQYEAMAATPLEPGDIAMAHALWMLFRTGTSTIAVAAVMALFPDVRSWGLIAAVPVAMLGGLAFGMPLAAYTVTRHRDMSFPVIQRFVIVPLFLFGGAFFPLDQLPLFIRVIGQVAPLSHAVELCRSFASGSAMSAQAALGHIAYLLFFAVGGTVVMRMLTKRRLFA